jgi:hypothetical protein
VVEGQHVISTRKLVETREEQEILEELIEDAKPRLPDDARERDLHYLLATPFRNPPLAHGSRFGSRDEPSLWYGSARRRTALAETAYYRLVFLEGTTADLGPLGSDFSIFDTRLATRCGVDLGRAPFDRFHGEIASPVSYGATQQLGREMRRDGVECLRYPSARDRDNGFNVAVFTPRVFAAKVPGNPETWHGVATRELVEFTKKDVFETSTFSFPRTAFEVDGRLPGPAL